jgi:hypothetical protein
MPNPQVTTRIPQAVLDRIDRLVDASAEADPANPLDRGGVVRALIIRALPDMESELQPKRPRRSR